MKQIFSINRLFQLLCIFLLIQFPQIINGQISDTLTYLKIERDGNIDTAYRLMINNSTLDSEFVCSFYHYENSNPDEKFLRKYIFPNSNDTIDDIWLVRSRIIYTKYGDYKIYKYESDCPDITDEESMYFYNPKLGILIEKSSVWGNYYRLFHSTSKDTNRMLFFLCDKIIEDQSFFQDWE